MKTDYQMKCCDLEEALRLSDIRKSYLEDQLEQARQCLSFKEAAKLIAENIKLRDAIINIDADLYHPGIHKGKSTWFLAREINELRRELSEGDK